MGAVVAFVAWDLSGWGYHLIGHRTRIGWAAHQPHHTGPGFDATLGLRQSWAPVHGLVHQPLLALAGFDLRVIFVCAAVSNGWQVLEHTSLTLPFPRWFAWVVMTPAAHRHHHRRDGAPVNLGPVFTIWDRLAGTWVSPALPAPAAYGLAASTSSNPVAIELAGWRHLARTVGRARHGSSATSQSSVPSSSTSGRQPSMRLPVGSPSAMSAGVAATDGHIARSCPRRSWPTR